MDLPCRILLAVLLASAILFLAPFFHKPKIGRPPAFAWAPGYWEIVPEVGIARIVPVSRSSLMAPAAGAAQSALRAPATGATR